MVLGLHHIGMLYKEGEQKKKEWRVRNTLPSTVLSSIHAKVQVPIHKCNLFFDWKTKVALLPN